MKKCSKKFIINFFLGFHHNHSPGHAGLPPPTLPQQTFIAAPPQAQNQSMGPGQLQRIAQSPMKQGIIQKFKINMYYIF